MPAYGGCTDSQLIQAYLAHKIKAICGGVQIKPVLFYEDEDAQKTRVGYGYEVTLPAGLQDVLLPHLHKLVDEDLGRFHTSCGPMKIPYFHIKEHEENAPSIIIAYGGRAQSALGAIEKSKEDKYLLRDLRKALYAQGR